MPQPAPVTSTEFTGLTAGLPMGGPVAVAVSGGPDSMALCRLLVDIGGGREIHALTVDHGLRPESGEEAETVGRILSGLIGVRHHILRWEGDKPDSRIMEQARTVRYRLMAGYCRAHGIKTLWLAHHEDDQAETFLFRLSKGSGLDGLAGMAPVQPCPAAPDVLLIRPLLSVPKARLMATCQASGLEYVTDPSNENPAYARPRLRAARAALEEEGLSGKRLRVTAARLGRAKEALEQIAAQAFAEDRREGPEGRVLLNFKAFESRPAEIRLRMLLLALEKLGGERDYGPRLERLETLAEALVHPEGFARRTLAGFVFTRRRSKGVLEICREEA